MAIVLGNTEGTEKKADINMFEAKAWIRLSCLLLMG